MALKEKFASAVAARTGIDQQKAAAAVGQVVDLIKTKVPPQLGRAFDSLLASDNGIDPAHFLVPIAARAVDRLPDGQFKQAAKAAVEDPGRFAALWRAIKGLFAGKAK